MVVTSVLGTIRYIAYQRDTDFIDRMHSFLTTNILIALSILVSFKQFGGKPIECMVPDTLTGSAEQYTESYCWSQDTYFLPFDLDIPQEIPKREDREISYYQWVPFFLLVQAACFRIPSLIWKYMAHHSGIKIHDIVKFAVDEKNVEAEHRQHNIDALSTHLQNALRFHRRLIRRHIYPHKFVRILNLPYSAFYVTTIYLVAKLLYLLNVVLQLYIMNKFMETDKVDKYYGFGTVFNMLNGTSWDTSGLFPRVTMCDFQVRLLGNVQRHTVQCVLVINLFNEKIFIFLWFWFVILLVLTAGSFVYWFLLTIIPWSGRRFICKHLELCKMPFDPEGSKHEVDRFVSNYLKADGVFAIRMITMHSGVIFGTDLVESLYKKYYGIEEEIKRQTPEAVVTPGTGLLQNRVNFLRLRKKPAKTTDDLDLDAKLIPPPDQTLPTAPILDMPDGAPGKRRPSLGLHMPGGKAPSQEHKEDSDESYKTARNTPHKSSQKTEV